MRNAAHLTLLALPAAAVALAAGCGGSSQPSTKAATLDRPGSTWATLGVPAQTETMRSCRLDAAVVAARQGGVGAAPYASGRYLQTLRLAGPELRTALGRWFAESAHRRATLADGCKAVVDAAAARAEHDDGAELDFAAPVTTARGALSVGVPGDHVRLRARISPATARVRIGPAPGRARSTAVATVRRSDGRVTIDLRRVPGGISYLRVTVSAPTGTWHRLMVVRRRPAPSLRPPRTFPPMVITGQGSRGLPVLYLPQRAIAIARTDGAPLALTTSDTLLLAHGHRDDDQRVPISPGRYRDVQVQAPGAWTIRIVPAP